MPACLPFAPALCCWGISFNARCLLALYPAGKLVWAKVGSSPWWPAKTLDPQRDPSYPPDADPPRPTSIPIRCALNALQ